MRARIASRRVVGLSLVVLFWSSVSGAADPRRRCADVASFMPRRRMASPHLVTPIFLTLVAVGPLSASPVVCHEDSRVAMGCTATVRVCGPDAAALPALVADAVDEIDRVDYAVDRVVELLRRRGAVSALVNLGGSSVHGLGTPPGKDAWEIGMQDPTRPGKIALTVPLRDRALSVAGGYERFFEKDGVTYSHIMDPRTGRPVQGVLSVAVLSPNATDGDALDDILFVEGVGRASALLERHPSTEALFFLPEGGRGWRLVRVRP